MIIVSHRIQEIKNCNHLPSESTEGTGNGNESSHLTKRQHGGENDGSDDGVGDQHRCWTTCGKTLSRAQEQTSADCTCLIVSADLE